MRFKLLLCGALTLIGLILMGSMGEQLIQLYLHTENGTTNAALTLQHGLDYLHIVMISFIPFAVVQAYAGTLKETGETMLPMKAGILSVVVNFCINYVLIFGKFGMPVLGARGAHRNRCGENRGDGYRRRLGAYEEGQKSLCQRTVPLNENTGRSGKRNCHQGNAALGQ